MKRDVTIFSDSRLSPIWSGRTLSTRMCLRFIYFTYDVDKNIICIRVWVSGQF